MFSLLFSNYESGKLTGNQSINNLNLLSPLKISKEEQKNNKSDDEQLNYYNEFCRLYLTNNVLAAQLKELSDEKNELITKLNRLEV